MLGQKTSRRGAGKEEGELTCLGAAATRILRRGRRLVLHRRGRRVLAALLPRSGALHRRAAQGLAPAFRPLGSLRAGKGEASWAGKGKGPAAVKGGATDSSGADSLSPGSSSARSPGGRAAGDERTRGTGRKDLIAKVFEILRGFL
jgi:hypothetical protein